MKETTFTPQPFEKVVFDLPNWAITVAIDPTYPESDIWIAHQCISIDLDTARKKYEWRVMVPPLMHNKTKCVFCAEKMPDEIQTIYTLLSM